MSKVGVEGWFGDDVEPFQGPWSYPTFQLRQPPEPGPGRAPEPGQCDVQPQHGPAAALGLGCGFQDLGGLRTGHWKARRNSLTVGSASTIKATRIPVGPHGLRQLLSGVRFHVQRASGERRGPTIGESAEQVAGGLESADRRGLGRHGRVTGRCAAASRSTATADPGQRPGTVSWEPSRAHPADLLCQLTEPSHLHAGHGQHAAVWIHVSCAGRNLTVSHCSLSRRKGGVRGPRSRSVPSTPTSLAQGIRLRRPWSAGSARTWWRACSTADPTQRAGLRGNQTTTVSYGTNINALPGGRLDEPPGTAPTRLNSSFGPINYTDNDRVATTASPVDLRGQFRRAFFDVSYTRSSAKDDAGVYPTSVNPHGSQGRHRGTFPIASRSASTTSSPASAG